MVVMLWSVCLHEGQSQFVAVVSSLVAQRWVRPQPQ